MNTINQHSNPRKIDSKNCAPFSGKIYSVKGSAVNERVATLARKVSMRKVAVLAQLSWSQGVTMNRTYHVSRHMFPSELRLFPSDTGLPSMEETVTCCTVRSTFSGTSNCGPSYSEAKQLRYDINIRHALLLRCKTDEMCRFEQQDTRRVSIR